MKTANETPEVQPKSDNKAPGFWFYPADYERDVQILSLAAQGLWSRMLCWMSDNEAHRGFLELPTGLPMTVDDVAAKVGKRKSETEKAIAEMERVGIFSRDDRGCIFCRRMARDTHISEVRRQAAKSRLESAKRAADGTFAGEVAGAKPSSKTEQNPTVTASVSVSVLPKQQQARVVEMPQSQPSEKFEEWWAVWSAVKGTNHRFNAEQVYPREVTTEMERDCFECTRSYLESLDNPAKGYNPENFLIDQRRDLFKSRWPPRASPHQPPPPKPFRPYVKPVAPRESSDDSSTAVVS